MKCGRLRRGFYAYSVLRCLFQGKLEWRLELAFCYCTLPIALEVPSEVTKSHFLHKDISDHLAFLRLAMIIKKCVIYRDFLWSCSLLSCHEIFMGWIPVRYASILRCTWVVIWSFIKQQHFCSLLNQYNTTHYLYLRIGKQASSLSLSSQLNQIASRYKSQIKNTTLQVELFCSFTLSNTKTLVVEMLFIFIQRWTR